MCSSGGHADGIKGVYIMKQRKYPDQGIVDRLNEVLTAHGSDSAWANNLEEFLERLEER